MRSCSHFFIKRNFINILSKVINYEKIKKTKMKSVAKVYKQTQVRLMVFILKNKLNYSVFAKLKTIPNKRRILRICWDRLPLFLASKNVPCERLAYLLTNSCWVWVLFIKMLKYTFPTSTYTYIKSIKIYSSSDDCCNNLATNCEFEDKALNCIKSMIFTAPWHIRIRRHQHFQLLSNPYYSAKLKDK